MIGIIIRIRRPMNLSMDSSPFQIYKTGGRPKHRPGPRPMKVTHLLVNNPVYDVLSVDPAVIDVILDLVADAVDRVDLCKGDGEADLV